MLNGKPVLTPAVNVGAKDRIEVDGKPLSTPEPVRLWRYHKPKGRVTTHRDPQGRPTVFEGLPPEMPRVISVGRLDLNSEGLLLLTTDGALARHLESPKTGWIRRYRVRVHGRVDPSALAALADGITVAGVSYGPVDARLDRTQGMNSWLTVALREGKNREIRRIMEHLGLTVSRLIRLSFGPFALGDLAPGAIAEVKRRVLADQLGEETARALGLKDRGPLRDAQAPQPGSGSSPAARPKPGHSRKSAAAGETTGRGRIAPKRRRSK